MRRYGSRDDQPAAAAELGLYVQAADIEIGLLGYDATSGRWVAQGADDPRGIGQPGVCHGQPWWSARSGCAPGMVLVPSLFGAWGSPCRRPAGRRAGWPRWPSHSMRRCPRPGGYVRPAQPFAGDGGTGGTWPPSSSVRVPSGSARRRVRGRAGRHRARKRFSRCRRQRPDTERDGHGGGGVRDDGRRDPPGGGRTVGTGRLQTKTWRSVVLGVGAGKAGSRAHVAGPKSAERTTCGSHCPMVTGCQPLASAVTSTATQPGGPRASVGPGRRRRCRPGRPGATAHVGAPGNAAPNSTRAARRASNAGPCSLWRPGRRVETSPREGAPRHR